MRLSIPGFAAPAESRGGASRFLVAVAVFVMLALLMLAGTARAQNVILDAPALFPTKKPGMPEVRVPSAVWPRLDPGAVLCKSEDDLARLAANRSGAAGGGRADCRVVNTPTPIQIKQRSGPGRTEIQVTANRQTGWTDAWLPERAPSQAGTAAAR